MKETVGVVVIGRNEGERLIQCFESLQQTLSAIIYVDSGSTDGSVEAAKQRDIEVLSLDTSIPFTAARARNTGFEHLLTLYPHLQFVQFVDGDCEVVSGWLETAYHALENNSEIAVVCGRRRERFPNFSIYNQLCDLEWDTPVGEAKACGGDSMMRVKAFQEVEGFNANLIAGEEPELCYRLRQQEWKIWRLDAEMTLHDAGMTRFSQWWKRNVRAGYAYAAGSWLHGKEAERYRVKETMSNWFWGGTIPVIVISGLWWTQGFSLLILAIYPLLVAKIYRYQLQSYSSSEARIYAVFCVLGKFPNVWGQFKFYWDQWRQQSSAIIEYKS